MPGFGAPGAGEVLKSVLRHLTSDPEAHVRAMAAELAGKFVHSDGRAVTALETSRAQDPSPVVRKKAGWFTPGGTIYQRTVAHASKQLDFIRASWAGPVRVRPNAELALPDNLRSDDVYRPMAGTNR